MRLKGILLSATVGVVAGCSTPGHSDPDVPSKAPVQELDWTGPRAFSEWGQTKGGFFGISAGTRVFQAWKWDGATLKRSEGVKLLRLLSMAPLPEEQYLAYTDLGEATAPWPLTMASLGAEDVIKKWEPPAGWGYEDLGISRNRAFAAITLHDREANPRQDNPGFRAGILNIATMELRWVVEHYGRVYGDIRQIAISDDGKYIAIPGWSHGVALVDVQAQGIRHYVRPPGVNSFVYARFSCDGLTLYAADAAGGCVYALETKTGKVLRRWYATETGESIYGHRISCLAVSPDDAWIAAGTGPEGQVFLFSTTSSESKPILLPHGLSTILIVSFSPDSKHLASVAMGKIKIWATKPERIKE